MIVPVCDCKGARELNMRVKCRGGFRYVVSPENDKCPHCGYYVHYYNTAGRQHQIRDGKAAYKRLQTNDYVTKTPLVKEFDGNAKAFKEFKI